MPNRIIREGIIDSRRMEILVRDAGWPAEVFYRRLQSVADDYGRFDGRLSVIKARCYPTVLELIREADVQRWITACEKAGLVRFYEVNDQPYLEILDFKQQTRAKTSRYPAPPARIGCVADDTQVRTYTETETETETGGVDPANAVEDWARAHAAEHLRKPEFFRSLGTWILSRDRKPSAITIRAQLNELAKGTVQEAIAKIEYSVRQGYAGIHAPKPNGHEAEASEVTPRRRPLTDFVAS